MPLPRESFRRSRFARLTGAVLVLPAFLVVACVTVNIYFPAPEVREAAERIVDETWGGQPSGKAAPGPQSSVLARIVVAASAVLTPGEAVASDVDVNVSTAAIRALKDGMKQRAEELKPLLRSGSVGVGRDGLLLARDTGAPDLAARAKIRRLVEAENKDREALYREIASANNFGSARVADIRTIFAQTWKDKAEPGWWIQAADGSWRQK